MGKAGSAGRRLVFGGPRQQMTKHDQKQTNARRLAATYQSELMTVEISATMSSSR